MMVAMTPVAPVANVAAVTATAVLSTAAPGPGPPSIPAESVSPRDLPLSGIAPTLTAGGTLPPNYPNPLCQGSLLSDWRGNFMSYSHMTALTSPGVSPVSFPAPVSLPAVTLAALSDPAPPLPTTAPPAAVGAPAPPMFGIDYDNHKRQLMAAVFFKAQMKDDAMDMSGLPILWVDKIAKEPALLTKIDEAGVITLDGEKVEAAAVTTQNEATEDLEGQVQVGIKQKIRLAHNTIGRSTQQYLLLAGGSLMPRGIKDRNSESIMNQKEPWNHMLMKWMREEKYFSVDQARSSGAAEEALVPGDNYGNLPDLTSLQAAELKRRAKEAAGSIAAAWKPVPQPGYKKKETTVRGKKTAKEGLEDELINPDVKAEVKSELSHLVLLELDSDLTTSRIENEKLRAEVGTLRAAAIGKDAELTKLRKDKDEELTKLRKDKDELDAKLREDVAAAKVDLVSAEERAVKKERDLEAEKIELKRELDKCKEDQKIAQEDMDEIIATNIEQRSTIKSLNSKVGMLEKDTWERTTRERNQLHSTGCGQAVDTVAHSGNHVTFKFLGSDAPIDIAFDPSKDRVADFKARICDSKRIPVGEQRFICNGKMLQDHFVVSPGSTIQVSRILVCVDPGAPVAARAPAASAAPAVPTTLAPDPVAATAAVLPQAATTQYVFDKGLVHDGEVAVSSKRALASDGEDEDDSSSSDEEDNACFRPPTKLRRLDGKDHVQRKEPSTEDEVDEPPEKKNGRFKRGRRAQEQTAPPPQPAHAMAAAKWAPAPAAAPTGAAPSPAVALVPHAAHAQERQAIEAIDGCRCTCCSKWLDMVKRGAGAR